ncbi:ZIP zinc transporter-domain-containing protein [Obelidium mucronatum]|nr:ZIP zinc transporter-domain-containing protein [Obelidium mucronatum]
MTHFLITTGKAPSSSDSSIDACSAEPIESYDLRFHIAGIFIVLLTSGFGIFSTLTLSLYRQKLKSYQTIIANILLLFKMFGIGVIAGTAWIHLLPDAFSQFSSPCLEQSWKAYGPAKSTVEFFNVIPASHGAATDFDQSLSTSRGLPTIILELGILFHSLIIGITLGVTPDGSFSTLLGAVCFHQMFEGMALGVLIGSLGNLTASTRLILGLLYPLTTPVGIAIGIAVRNSYNSNSSHLIILQGILDSLSAGILFFNTYCELNE